MYFWDSIRLSYSLFSSPISLPNYGGISFRAVKTVVFNFFDGADGLIAFSLRKKTEYLFFSPGRWLILHAVMCRATIPRDTGILVKRQPEILQMCIRGANRCFRNLQMSSNNKCKVLPLGGNTLCISAGQGLTGLGTALQKGPELLVDQWTWIQHHAHAVAKVKHINQGQVLIPLCPGLVGLNL